MTTQTKSYLLNTPEALKKEKLRLEKQADALFELERPLLENIMPGPVRALLDLGCGNAFYTSQLQKLFSVQACYGYERNQNLIEQANTEFPNIKIIHGDLTNLELISKTLTEIRPDLINLRFVLQHMRPEERSNLLSVLKQNMKSGCRLIITEPNDSQIRITPDSENIKYLIHRTIGIQAERGGDRTIAGKLSDELSAAGFSTMKVSSYSLGNSTLSLKVLFDLILPLWRSYRSNENKEQLDSRVEEARLWLERQEYAKNLRFDFPIYIYEVNA